MEPVAGLAYRILAGQHGPIVTGITDDNGLTSIVRGSEGAVARFQVERLSGGYKEIHQTLFPATAKVVTATSPAIKIESNTEPHVPGDVTEHPVVIVDAEDVTLEFLREFDGSKIGDEDFELAAVKLGCEVAAIKAVAETESGTTGSFFSFPGWEVVPAILYERHYFHQLTGGVYDKTHPDLSSPNPGGYGKYSAQYRKLIRAYKLAPEAALKSASWGKFQIMGRWHEQAGYDSVQAFVHAISVSEKNHLAAFVNFIQADRRLSAAVVKKDWLSFALVYNGPRQNGYDERMEEAYERYSN